MPRIRDFIVRVFIVLMPESKREAVGNRAADAKSPKDNDVF
jgi:hypothetical protein